MLFVVLDDVFTRFSLTFLSQEIDDRGFGCEER